MLVGNTNKLILFVMLILLSSFIYAQPPITTVFEGTEGYQIETPAFTYLEQGADHTFNFHLFNLSNGVPIYNDVLINSTSCDLHLYNNNGQTIYLKENITENYNLYDWEVEIGGNNFTEVGKYSTIFQCYDNTSNLGGFIEFGFEVTPNGQESTTSNGILYSSLLMILLVFFTASTIGAFKIDGKNEYDVGGKIMTVNFNKYYKMGLFFLSYLLLIFITHLSYVISYNFMFLSSASGIFSVIYKLLWILFFPVFFAVVIVAFIKFALDMRLEKLAQRNLKDRQGGKKGW